MKILSAIQPSFFPWPGYFDIIKRSNIFLYYDHVQFDKNGWRNRNYFEINGKRKFITLPIIHDNLLKKINETKIFIPNKSLNKIYKSLYFNYKNYKKFDEINQIIIENIIKVKWSNLSKFNIFFSEKICEYLNIKTRRYISSDYKNIEDRNANLINLCKKFKCDTYLSGVTAKNYIDENLFNKNEITVIWHKYQDEYNLKTKQYSNLNFSMLHHILVEDYLL